MAVLEVLANSPKNIGIAIELSFRVSQGVDAQSQARPCRRAPRRRVSHGLDAKDSELVEKGEVWGAVYGKDRDTFNGKANELLEAIRIERDIWDQAVAIRPSLSSFMRLPILTSVRHSLMFNTPWPFLIYLPSSTTPSTRVSPLEKVQSVHVLMTT